MLRSLLLAGLIPAILFSQERPRLRPIPKAGMNMKTGPAVGARIPDFELEDQWGRRRNLDSLRGPKGLVLMFVRSADW